MSCTLNQTTHNDLPVIHMHHSSGATLMVYLFGAHIASWTTLTKQEILFVSNSAVYDGKAPIRGGIPLVFPQFGGGALPSHGFARRSVWSLHSSSDMKNGTLVLSLKDNDSTRRMWNEKFTLLYRITLGPNTLTTSFEVENQSDAPFEFQALLHTYFKLRDVAQAEILGLSGQTYVDQLQDGASVVQQEDPLKFTQETDRIFMNAPAEIILKGLALQQKEQEECAVTVNESMTEGSVTVNVSVKGSNSNINSNSHDFVIWNPWIAKAKRMNDFGDDEYHHMCCVEPGYVAQWKTLQNGEKWSITQVLTVHVATASDGGETKL